MSAQAELRIAARVLVVDAAARVLLFRYRHPTSGDTFWAPPGGGAEPGETPEQTALRELAEETGLAPPGLGRPVWRREHTFDWGGRWIRQRELLFLLRVERYELPASLAVAHRSDRIEAARWWQLDELEREAVQTAPRRLAPLLVELLAAGPPDEPLDVGV